MQKSSTNTPLTLSTFNTLAHDANETFVDPDREIEKGRGIEEGSGVNTSDKTDNDGDDRADVGWGGEDGAGGGGASDRLREVGRPPDIEGDDDEENAEVELDIPGGAIDNGEEEEEDPAVAAEEEEEEEEDEEELLLFSDSCGAANTANDNSTLATPTEEDADDEDEDNNSSGAVAVAVVEQERLREEENPDDEIPAPDLESTVLESADIDPEIEAEGAPSLENTQERREGASGDNSKSEKMVAMESAHMVN